MTLGLEPPRPGVMEEPPRSSSERILSWPRFARLLAFGAVMAVGTLGMFARGTASGGRDHAMTLAFTTFVLFQLFNVFNARVEHGTAFHREFFANPRLWTALGVVLGCQILVVHLGVAQRVFHTAPLSAADWALSALVASSILVLEEGRKLAVRLLGGPKKDPPGRGAAVLARPAAAR